MPSAVADEGPPEEHARALGEAWLRVWHPETQPELPPHLAQPADSRLALLGRAYEALFIALSAREVLAPLAAIESICSELQQAGWEPAVRLAQAALIWQLAAVPDRHAQGLSLLESHGEPASDPRPSMERAWTDIAGTHLLTSAGRYDDALKVGLTAQQIASAGRNIDVIWHAEHVLSLLFWTVGDIEGALTGLQSELFEKVRRESGRVHSYYNLLLALVLGRRLDELREVLRGQPALTEERALQEHPPSAYLLAYSYLLLGQPDRAQALLSRVKPIRFFISPHSAADCAWMAAAVMLANGDAQRAVRELNTFLGSADAKILAPVDGTQIYRVLSEAHEACGQAVEALAALKESQRFCFSWVAASVRCRLIVLGFDNQATPQHEALQSRRLRAIDEAASSARLPASAQPAHTESRFLAHVMHELRNPLAGVVGMTSLLMMTDLDVRQRQYANLANTSAQTLMALCNDILDVAKMSAGHFVLHPVPVDLRRVIIDTVEVLRPLAESKRLAYRTIVDEAIPGKLQCDPLRLRQVLMNLLSNAIKFTAHGEVEVRAAWHARRESSGAGELHLSVHDTGSGLSQFAKQHLFEEFMRFGTDPAANSGGTGLGLSLCRQLVTMMGGRIEVDSEVGRGSTFTVVVPLAPPPAAPLEPQHRLDRLSVEP